MPTTTAEASIDERDCQHMLHHSMPNVSFSKHFVAQTRLGMTPEVSKITASALNE